MSELLFLAWRRLSTREWTCLGAIGLALCVWTVMPGSAQDPRYHNFADQRHWLGIDRSADVLSNAGFVLIGLLAVVRLVSTVRERLSRASEAGLWCVALGFVGTGAGSAWYHLDPSDSSLVWDRLPMTVVFAGILGTALAQRVGEDVARFALALLLELGVASVFYWHVTGDLSLYLMLQFGGIAALVLLVLSTRRGEDPFPWWWLIGWYALAKVLEAGDVTIWRMTHGLVAGHALKHLAATAAGAMFLMPLLIQSNAVRRSRVE